MSKDCPLRLLTSAGFALLAVATLAAQSSAQMAPRLDVDPDMPVKEGFDTDRAIFWAHPNFTPLRDPEWVSLRSARRSGDVSDGTTVVSFDMAGRTYALVSSQMSYHHVAQGRIAGEPWMVTFWVICNTGVRMAPSVDGAVHSFAEHGLYGGLFLLRDDESGTYWDHMTGEAVYGPLVGNTLEVMNLMQSTVAQVLRQDADAMVTISDQAIRSDEQMTIRGLLSSPRKTLGQLFGSTVEKEDDRRPTMDLGMGVWAGDEAHYYPYERVVAANNAVFDVFVGRQIVVYLDPTAYALSAAFVDAASFEWDGDVLRFSDGTYIEGGIYHSAAGVRANLERPLQVFTRWYGFSLTFPQTEIYGGNGS